MRPGNLLHPRATKVARSQKSPGTGKLSKRPASTWAGMSSSQESLRRFLPRHSVAAPPGLAQVPGVRFLRHMESIGPMGSQTPFSAGTGVPPPVGRLPIPAKERDGRSASCSSSTMSSTGYSSIGLLASRARLRFTGMLRINSGQSPVKELPSNGYCVFPRVSHRRGSPHRSASICVHLRPSKWSL
jgi:hypothetical protein